MRPAMQGGDFVSEEVLRRVGARGIVRCVTYVVRSDREKGEEQPVSSTDCQDNEVARGTIVQVLPSY